MKNKGLLQTEQRKHRITILILLALCFTAIILSLLSGRYRCTKADLLYAIAYKLAGLAITVIELPGRLLGHPYTIANPVEHYWGKDIETVLWTIRFPRILAVALIGGGLSIAGASLQSVFKNPLVSEGILGVSNGASLGAVIALLLRFSSPLVCTCAFLGGIGAVALTYSCSKVFRGNPTLLLILSGTVVGNLFNAGTSIVKYLAPPDTVLPEITFWLMGSFAGINMAKLTLLGPIILVCCIGIYIIRWQLNLMSMGEEEAKSLGVNTGLIRFALIVFSTLITSAAVCICGIIGWVGMVIPQLTRLVVGPDARRLIPSTFFIGAIFLLLVDIVCRTLTASEIPVGIVTSIIGAPAFLILLKRVKEGWA